MAGAADPRETVELLVCKEVPAPPHPSWSGCRNSVAWRHGEVAEVILRRFRRRVQLRDAILGHAARVELHCQRTGPARERLRHIRTCKTDRAGGRPLLFRLLIVVAPVHDHGDSPPTVGSHDG